MRWIDSTPRLIPVRRLFPRLFLVRPMPAILPSGSATPMVLMATTRSRPCPSPRPTAPSSLPRPLDFSSGSASGPTPRVPRLCVSLFGPDRCFCPFGPARNLTCSVTHRDAVYRRRVSSLRPKDMDWQFCGVFLSSRLETDARLHILPVTQSDWAPQTQICPRCFSKKVTPCPKCTGSFVETLSVACFQW